MKKDPETGRLMMNPCFTRPRRSREGDVPLEEVVVEITERHLSRQVKGNIR